MDPQPQPLVIFFADIAGSTRLYEQLGDVAAHECVVESLDELSSHIERNDGRVVEIIGDEVMACFDRPQDALNCACEIQNHFQYFKTSHQQPIKIRIGFHFGPVVLENGHPYGDTVNVASRVASLSQGGQILITGETFNVLPHEMALMCRLYNKVRVKGKSQPLDTREVVWDQADATSIYVPRKNVVDETPALELILEYQGHQIRLTEADTPFLIGRGEFCNLVVPSDTASRSHARIDGRFGQLIMVDHSTNGTYICKEGGMRAADGLELHLHHKEWTLSGKGLISLGKPSATDDPMVIRYRVESQR